MWSSTTSARSTRRSPRCGGASSAWAGTSGSSACCRCSSAAWAWRRCRGRGWRAGWTTSPSSAASARGRTRSSFSTSRRWWCWRWSPASSARARHRAALGRAEDARRLLPAELIRPWQPDAIVRGVLLGLAVAVVFTLPLLVGLRRVPPVRVLRRARRTRAAELGGAGLGAAFVLGGVWAAATAQAESLRYGTIFAAGLVGVVLLLAAAAAGVSRLARLLPRDAGGVRLPPRAGAPRPPARPPSARSWRWAWASRSSSPRASSSHLSEQLRAELPADAPSTFLVDVQPDQWPRIEEMLKPRGGDWHQLPADSHRPLRRRRGRAGLGTPRTPAPRRPPRRG